MFSFRFSTGSSLLSFFRFVYSLVCFLKEEILPNVFCRRAVVEQKRSVLFPLSWTFKTFKIQLTFSRCVLLSLFSSLTIVIGFILQGLSWVTNLQQGTQSTHPWGSLFLPRAIFIWIQVLVVNKIIYTCGLTDTWDILEMQNGNKSLDTISAIN